VPSTSVAPPTSQRVFEPETRPLTIGILLGITLVAFEALAVVTVAPLFAADLDGLALYGWVFSGFLLASLLGSVLGGQMADTGSMARPLLVGLVFFGVGLVVSGAAVSMTVLLAGRVLQGLGGGVLGTVMYAVINRAYPDGVRARIMALTSSAWIVPALLGPTLAGIIAEASHWRYVFWSIVPLLVVVGALTLGAFGKITSAGTAQAVSGPIGAALLLTLGAGLSLVGIGAERPWLAAVLAVPGAVLIVLGLRALMPEGTLRLRRGLPAVVAGRGLLSSAFIGVEAFMALMLTTVHGYSITVTGFVIATGALSWAFGAWLQARLDVGRAHQRPQRMFLGICLMTIGIALQLVALFATSVPLVIVVVGWVLAGTGIGASHATASVLAFALAPEGEEGRVAAAVQVSDQLLQATSTGVGGALLALATRQGWGARTGILLALVFVLMLAALAMVAGWRAQLRAEVPDGSPNPRQ
jgi:MFS family permease